MGARLKWLEHRRGRLPKFKDPPPLRLLALWAGGLLVSGLVLWGCSKKTLTSPDTRAPVIALLTATPNVVGRGEISLLACSAQDPDGDSVSYAWTATTGTFLTLGGDSAANGYARWKAPDTAASATVTVTASDNRGKSSQKLVAITVTVYRLVAWWGSLGFGSGQFTNPNGIAVSPTTGAVYVADAGNNRIQKFDANGAFIRQWVRGDGDTVTAHPNLKAPRGVAVDRLNNVYVADYGNRMVQWFADNSSVIQYRGYYQPSADSFWALNGAAVTADLDLYVTGYDSLGNGILWRFPYTGTHTHWAAISPGGVGADNSGYIYAPSTSGNRVQVFGAYIGEFGSVGDSTGEFNAPYGAATDDSEDVFITDAGNDRVQEFRRNADNTFSYRTQFGSLGSGLNQFNSPLGIAVGPDYSVYVVDAGNCQVKKFSAK